MQSAVMLRCICVLPNVMLLIPVILSIAMLSIIMLSVIMLNVLAPLLQPKKSHLMSTFAFTKRPPVRLVCTRGAALASRIRVRQKKKI